METDLHPSAPLYTVKQVAELTGLSLNQVRLWERRYQLIQPQRAENGYRLYSQQDLDILKYAQKQVLRGHGISRIAQKLKENPQMPFQKQVAKNTLPRSVPRQTEQIPNYDLMINAIQMDNPLKFEQLLIQAQAGQGFTESIQKVDLPILAKLGELSMAGKIPISGPHIAAAVIRRRMMAHVQNLRIPKYHRPVILACAPHDFHEVGILYCWMALTERLMPTLYLGPHVPISEIRGVLKQVQPLAILLSLNAPMNQAEVQQYIQEIQTLNGLPVAVGGYEALRLKADFETAGIQVLESVGDVLAWEGLKDRPPLAA